MQQPYQTQCPGKGVHGSPKCGMQLCLSTAMKPCISHRRKRCKSHSIQLSLPEDLRFRTRTMHSTPLPKMAPIFHRSKVPLAVGFILFVLLSGVLISNAAPLRSARKQSSRSSAHSRLISRQVACTGPMMGQLCSTNCCEGLCCPRTFPDGVVRNQCVRARFFNGLERR